MDKRTLLILGGLLALVGFFGFTPVGKRYTKMISEAGLNFLKQIESFSSTPYWDRKGWSIGFGHFMGASKAYSSISIEQGLELLKQDLQWVELAIAKRVKVPLNQNQHDALVSFIYNEGETNFAGSTLLKKLNAGDYAGAAAEFPKWNKSHKNGVLVVDTALVDRRAKERAIFEAA